MQTLNPILFSPGMKQVMYFSDKHFNHFGNYVKKQSLSVVLDICVTALNMIATHP